jgi:hypothetical protein
MVSPIAVYTMSGHPFLDNGIDIFKSPAGDEPRTTPAGVSTT